MDIEVQQTTNSLSYHSDSLGRLIDRLDLGIKTNAGYMKTIRYPRLLIDSLKELNDVIGNRDLKCQITKQVEHLIANEIRRSAGEQVEDETMLNIVMYGPPGSGKTMISHILGKIFYALGVLRERKVSNSESTESFESNLTNMVSEVNQVNILANFINIMFLLLLGMLALGKFIPEKHMLSGVITFAIIYLVIGFMLYRSYFSGSKQPVVNQDKKPFVQEKVEKKEKKEKIARNSFVTKCGKPDFTGEYLGKTGPKTRKFLEDNVGKVVFIDEAYNLIEGPQDIYGKEAATEIIQFMSERPRDIIFIIAGYEADLHNSLFKYQEGFLRRFKYRWHCPGYTPNELFEVFKYQVRKFGWKIEDEIGIKQLILDNASYFEAFAGDMEKLFGIATEEHSQDLIHGEVPGLTTLTTSQVSNAIESFKKNVMKKPKNDNLLDAFKQLRSQV